MDPGGPGPAPVRAGGRTAPLRRDRGREPRLRLAPHPPARGDHRVAGRDRPLGAGRGLRRTGPDRCLRRSAVTAVEPDHVRRVGVVGAGVIGGGWALHYLRMGLDVDVYDPGTGAHDALLAMRDRIWPLMKRMGLRAGASPDRLVLHADLASAVRDADVIQENAP